MEKAEPKDYVFRELENDGEKIVLYDWKAHIHEEVASDLKKYRSYHGSSVRDLLRALRNKVMCFYEKMSRQNIFTGIYFVAKLLSLSETKIIHSIFIFMYLFISIL